MAKIQNNQVEILNYSYTIYLVDEGYGIEISIE